MSYRRNTPAPGGRRETRYKSRFRRRTVGTVGAGVALTAFAVGSFASVGVNAWAAPDSQSSIATADATVAPVEATGADLRVVTQTEEVTIEHGSVEEKDYSTLSGNESVVTEGQDGTAVVSYQVTLKDGVEVERSESMTVVVEEPVDEVVSVGAMSIPTSTSNAGTNRAIGQEMAAAQGWTGDQWQCLNALWTKESNWNSNATNPSSGAHGIPQALPGSKMASHGSDWATNPATQISWGLSYIKGRYGSPCSAWGHSQSVGWY
ncbi:G5 domain-containing protein [Demequina sp. B12]|uniref:aggregation-promoting factor C-terminal-like domain-containing protein n=1 Tax=Demequina sp. B12 TaxID=2992757 RepID=UPI00237C37F8|nr:G5 domain-containing protein [Demequina sp. B12]MDE0573758.1 G5 domain-containing protein [Demequina sp. B12]